MKIFPSRLLLSAITLFLFTPVMLTTTSCTGVPLIPGSASFSNPGSGSGSGSGGGSNPVGGGGSGSGGSSGFTVGQGTTTLAALTANNTAACPAGGTLPAWCQHAFTGQLDSRSGVATPEFDPPAGNVSDEDIHGYLAKSSSTKIFANFMLGFCTTSSSAYCSNNVQTGYTADDSRTVAAQAADLMRRHIDGAIMSWDGSGTSQDDATLLFQSWADRNACSSGKCKLTYLIMYNTASLNYNVQSTGIPGTSGKSCSGLTDATYENCVIAHLRNDLCHINSAHWGNGAYQKINGRPILQFFLYDSVIPATGPAPSWVDVWKHVGEWVQDLPHNCSAAPYNANNGIPLLVFENAGGFTESSTSGAFYWIKPEGTDIAIDQLIDNIAGTGGTLDSFLSSALSYSSDVAFSGAFKGFNSIQAQWGAGRIMDQQCGTTWITSLTESKKYYSEGAPYLQIATWNDYNEGTEIEAGIDNCFTVRAALAGSYLQWNLDPSNNSASLDTVSHIEIYDSADGQNVTLVATRPGALSGTWSLASLTSGQHVLYVRMVGKNSILNQISAAVPYHR